MGKSLQLNTGCFFVFPLPYRFQEIAGSLEEKLSLPLLEAAAAGGVNQGDDVRGFPTPHPPPPPFKLELFHILWKCMYRCWQDGVFVLALVHRFWKLTLQVYSTVSMDTSGIFTIIVIMIYYVRVCYLGMDYESYFISFLQWR